MQEEQSLRPAPRRGIAAVWDRAWLLMILPGLFWSSNAIIGRAVIDVLPPMGLSFWRWFVASFLVLPLAWPHLRRDLFEMLRAWPMTLVLSLGVAGFNSLSYVAAHTTTAVNILLLQASMPVLVVAATYLLFGDRISRRQAAG